MTMFFGPSVTLAQYLCLGKQVLVTCFRLELKEAVPVPEMRFA